jgi:hypothetical protein
VKSESSQRKIARRKIVTSDAEIDHAIERSMRLREHPLAAEIEYRPGPGLDLFLIRLTDGSRRVFPREDLQGLQSGTREQLSRVEIVGGGTGLHWPELDADIYVPALLRGIYGNKLWMAKIGHRGGSVKSAAKKAAARANGKLGGRPRRGVATGIRA